MLICVIPFPQILLKPVLIKYDNYIVLVYSWKESSENSRRPYRTSAGKDLLFVFSSTWTEILYRYLKDSVKIDN